MAKSRFGSRRFRMSTGTGFAQPISGAPVTMAINGKRRVPMGSTCTAGLSDSRPSNRAVGSPSQFAVHACAASWNVSDAINTTNVTIISPKSRPAKDDQRSTSAAAGNDAARYGETSPELAHDAASEGGNTGVSPLPMTTRFNAADPTKRWHESTKKAKGTKKKNRVDLFLAESGRFKAGLLPCSISFVFSSFSCFRDPKLRSVLSHAEA